MTTSPEEIINFWFSDKSKPLWFNSTTDFDNQIKTQFESVWEDAVAKKAYIEKWRESAQGSLALIIVFDQFPLNMYRNQAKSFQSESLAIETARNAINLGHDKLLKNEQLAFLYLPFMHSEDLADQNLSVKLFDAADLTENARFARHHRKIIEDFGRFPHRNEILGRESSKDELAYLNSDEAFTG